MNFVTKIKEPHKINVYRHNYNGFDSRYLLPGKVFHFSIDKRLSGDYTLLRWNKVFLDSSMVEHSAVNRVVVGSSPTRGA